MLQDYCLHVFLLICLFSNLIAFPLVKPRGRHMVRSLAVPSHVAFIVDGNGRWAVKQGKSRSDGHAAGANVTVDIVKKSFEMGVQYVTLYLFSTENWKRPNEEIYNIFSLLESNVRKFNGYLTENDIALKVIGQTYRLPVAVRTVLQTAQDRRPGKVPQRTLCLALSYGGRDDIVEACRNIVRDKVAMSAIDEELFAGYTSTGQLGIPDPDLIIRTSEFRLSNFLLYQAAYAEFASVDCPWPEFNVAVLDEILSSFSSRTRRFGGFPPSP